MKWTQWSGKVLLLFVSALALVSTGCPRNDTKGGNQQAKNGDKKGPGATHKHEGWWCEPHGVPEHLCSLCLSDDDVKKMFKDTGDWCKIHDRAQSQCFKCDPSLYKKFEAMYEAKYGSKPKPPPKEEFEK